jgi:hypothetical protein
MTMKTTMKTMIMIATPDISPSVYWVDLEEEYNPYLEWSRSREVQDHLHSEWKDKEKQQRWRVLDSEP